ncbi:MAG: GH1 family beta-glucosidase [Phycisphaerae bacterium]
MRQFPESFLWGAATAAFQVEGSPLADGRGPSIWDVFCQTPGKTVDGVAGIDGADHYRRWREDVAIMREIGLQAYRFSISWPRVMPLGRGDVNQAGIDFYDKLVDELCAAGIAPAVTLYHWDLPAALQMELGGWANDDIADIFADYAEIMFKKLGDRVSLWMTLNEPWCSVDGGYFHGGHAPGAKDRRLGYRAGHNLMRAHGRAVARFRATQPKSSKISFALNTGYFFPATESREDREAAERAILDMAGWFGDPVWFGDYPAVMRERYGDLLPVFSDEDTRLLKKSIDYVALNYYFSHVARFAPGKGAMEYDAPPRSSDRHTEMGWPVTPEGFAPLLKWLSDRYGKLPLYVMENGMACPDVVSANGEVNDQDRIRYLREHLQAAHRAMQDGVDLRGYFAWSFIDNLEWSLGRSKRFGLVRCDFENYARTIKASGHWYTNVIRTGSVDGLPVGECVAASELADRRLRTGG